MDQQNVKNKKHWKKAAAALFLVLVLTFSPCASLLLGSVTASADTFRIELLHSESMIRDGNFTFFGSRMRAELFYWIKSDGSPLFCIQKKAHLIGGLTSDEVGEEFDNSSYLSEEKYELVSLVLQCCGMLRGESVVLEPGVYMAGQSAVWGITSSYWTTTQQLRSEMEKVYAHIEDWNGTPAEEILSQAQETTEKICQAIDAYYGDESPYIPAFASKYKAKAPIWKAPRLEDGSCEAVFKLGDKAEAVKEFIFELPDGWTYEWQGDWIKFRGEQVNDGLISVSGRAGPGTKLESAMPIGLMYIVGSVNYPYLQRLASEVELKTGWSCYFQLLVSSEEDAGNWYLPEVQYYRHQEKFHALYGVELEKTDGDTNKAIAGVEFQPLEYFDSAQLEGTVLDKNQIECWAGWKARCSPAETDEEGKLNHWDKKEYSYERTYCSGHPEPVITYEGSSAYRREQLEEEAEAAWENAVEECSRLCDFHTVDGSGAELLREERNLALDQFMHLRYGYSFRETKPAEGYLPHGQSEKDKEIEHVFLLPVQAEDAVQEETGLWQVSVRKMNMVRALSENRASSSDVERKNRKDNINSKEKEEGEKAVSEEDMASQSNAQGEQKKPGRKVRKEVPVWLTSLVEVLEQQDGDFSLSYTFSVKNYQPEKPPEEPTPEETTPEETPPEKTTPEETPPEKTTPEETLPEETTPEETLPEETPPESTPEETIPTETPPESLPQETLPPESTPESVPPPSVPRRPRKSQNKDEPVPSLPEKTTEVYPLMEDMVPQASSRLGWIKAEYVLPTLTRESRDKEVEKPYHYLPETRDKGAGIFVVLLLAAEGGCILLMVLKRKRKGKDVHFHPWLFGIFILLICAGDVQAQEIQTEKTETKEQQAGGGKTAEQIDRSSYDNSSNGNKLVRYLPADPELIKTEEAQIEEWFMDKYGQRYHLDFYRPAEQQLEEKEEQVSEMVYYKGVEAESQIPEHIFAQSIEEETGREGMGQLSRGNIMAVNSYWAEDFKVNLTFCDYDAESFQIQEMEVPKDGALDYLTVHQGRFLELIGCSPERYQIKEILWSGESYAAQGIMCRDAQIYGRRLVSDMAVEYTGTVHYPQQMNHLWEAVYSPEVNKPPSIMPTTQAAIEETMKKELSEPPVPLSEKDKNLWNKIRTWAAYSVSLAVLLPSLLYIFLLLHKKRKNPSKLHS